MASKRYRLLRISLFGMLVLTPFWAVLVGWIYSGWHQRQVVLSLEEEGCYVSYSNIEWWNLYRRMSVMCLGNAGGNIVEMIDLGNTKFESARDDLALFQKIEVLPSVQRITVETRDRLVFPNRMRLPNLRGLYLRATRADYSSTAPGGLDFPRMENITFWYTQGTDDVFSKFSDLSNLKQISLSGRGFTGEFLKDASFKDSLTVLDIGDGTFDDQFVSYLADFKNLTNLQLRWNRISDKAVSAIKQLNKLETLDIADTKVSFSGVCELGRLERLRWLSIGTTNDDFLQDSIRPDQEFPRFPSLKVLWVDVCSLDATLIGKLSQYDNLAELMLTYNDVAEDAQTRLDAFYDETKAERFTPGVDLSETMLINDLFARFTELPRVEDRSKD